MRRLSVTCRSAHNYISLYTTRQRKSCLDEAKRRKIGADFSAIIARCHVVCLLLPTSVGASHPKELAKERASQSSRNGW